MHHMHQITVIPMTRSLSKLNCIFLERLFFQASPQELQRFQKEMAAAETASVWTGPRYRLGYDLFSAGGASARSGLISSVRAR